MMRTMLTTYDNPYDPFEDYDEWYAYDVRSGHHSASLLARIAVVDDDLSEVDIELALEQAIDEIVLENVNGMYRKVQKEIPNE